VGGNDGQTITGPAVTDGYGTREPFIVLEPGTVASAVLPDGTVWQSIPVTGTPYSLEYLSNRSMSYGAGFQHEFPLTPAMLPPGLKRVTAKLTVAGREFSSSFEAKPQQNFVVVWDGKDNFGRLLYLGNGDQRSADSVALVTRPASEDATFSLGTPDSIFVGSDGSLIVTDDQQQSATASGRILRITADGKPSVIWLTC
jgi:hypothetical protein